MSFNEIFFMLCYPAVRLSCNQKQKTLIMKATQTTSNKTAKLIVLVVFMFSGVAMFGQAQTNSAAPASENTVAVSASVSAESATLNMVSWFMGTKQTINSNEADVTSSSKKQLINSGIAPNRLLVKAFLKKASNYASTVA